MIKSMKTFETKAHTGSDDILHLDVDAGSPDTDVLVKLELLPPAAPLSERPPGYFENLPGSMTDLKRWPQGEFEQRDSFE